MKDDWKQKLKDEYLSIEHNPRYTADQQAERVIRVTAAVCAGVAIQPIPFADMFVLTPIEGFMGYKLAQVRGVNLRESGVQLLKALGGTIGLGWAAQQFGIGFYKLIPYLGALTTIPLVYTLAYSIGKVMDFYLKCQAEGREPSKEEIREVFRRGKHVAEEQKLWDEQKDEDDEDGRDGEA